MPAAFGVGSPNVKAKMVIIITNSILHMMYADTDSNYNNKTHIIYAPYEDYIYRGLSQYTTHVYCVYTYRYARASMVPNCHIRITYSPVIIRCVNRDANVYPYLCAYNARASPFPRFVVPEINFLSVYKAALSI